jgi:hypothetical protein
MENSIGRSRLLLAAGVVVALLPLGVAEAKDWKPGDPGSCPGTWEDGKCKRPYLCEPTRCYWCYTTQGGKCLACGVPNWPSCKGAAGGVKLLPGASSSRPLKPSDESKHYHGNYCETHLVQSQLRPFETRCENNPGGQSHCSVNTSKVPNDFTCCCTYSKL